MHARLFPPRRPSDDLGLTRPRRARGVNLAALGDMHQPQIYMQDAPSPLRRSCHKNKYEAPIDWSGRLLRGTWCSSMICLHCARTTDGEVDGAA